MQTRYKMQSAYKMQTRYKMQTGYKMQTRYIYIRLMYMYIIKSLRQNAERVQNAD